MIPWSPLARGRLARGASSFEPTPRSQTDRFGRVLYDATADADARVLERLDSVAKARRVPNAQVALAWLLRQPAVTAPIVGATKMQHLDDAIAAVSIKLSDDEMKLLEEKYVPHSVVGFA